MGVVFTLVALGHTEFFDTFIKCECGHNFELTGKETEDELQKHYSEMDNIISNLTRTLAPLKDSS